jgi:CubicO group peptidase (beta-lactamase class C family)
VAAISASAAIVAIVALGAFPCGATGLRDDPALRRSVEAQGRRFVEAVNSNDVALRTRALREIFASASLAGDGEQKLLRLLERLRDDLDTLAFHHAEAISTGEGDDRRVSLHVYARSARDGQWHDLQFRLDPAPPHRIQSLAFLASVAEPVYLPNGGVTSASTLQWLNGYVDKLAADNDLSGAILIAAGDHVIFQRGFGFADASRRHPIGPATRFDLASGGKMFTALAIAQLVQEGRMHFGDTLATLLPELADREFAHTVTLANLLTHTSGLGEYWDDAFEKHWHDIRTLRQYLPFVLAAGTHFKPGERFEYCNSNYILAGLVLEAATGLSYDQMIAKRIFEPLGMRDTGLFPFDDGDSLIAAPLTGEPRHWRVADHGYRGSSAGGCLSTCADMLRFARGLVRGRIVSDSMLTVMTTSKTEGLEGRNRLSYGYGFETERSAGGARSFGHGGIARGVNFAFRYFPDSDVTLLVFSNQDNGAYDDLRRNAIKLITGER